MRDVIHVGRYRHEGCLCRLDAIGTGLVKLVSFGPGLEAIEVEESIVLAGIY